MQSLVELYTKAFGRVESMRRVDPVCGLRFLPTVLSCALAPEHSRDLALLCLNTLKKRCGPSPSGGEVLEPTRVLIPHCTALSTLRSNSMDQFSL